MSEAVKDLSGTIYSLQGNYPKILEYIKKEMTGMNFSSLKNLSLFISNIEGGYTRWNKTIKLSDKYNKKLYNLFIDLYEKNSYSVENTSYEQVIKYLTSPLLSKSLSYRLYTLNNSTDSMG